MVDWQKYADFGRITQLKNEGRELLGEPIFWTVKRDGSNIPISLRDDGTVRVSSHNFEDIKDATMLSRILATKEYPHVVDALHDDPETIIYCEYIPIGRTPTRIEPRHKIDHLVIIDIWNKTQWMSYNYCHQVAYHNHIPIVPLLEVTTFTNMDDLFAYRDKMLKWCVKHRREGVVGKTYYTNPQYFFKEKIDLPKASRDKTASNDMVILPPMPDDKILHAIQQAEEQVKRNGGNFSQPKDAMPIVAQHIAAQGREHNYAQPRNLFILYQKYLEGKLVA